MFQPFAVKIIMYLLLGTEKIFTNENLENPPQKKRNIRKTP